MGSPNPKPIEALRWATMEEDKITAAAGGDREFRGPQFSAAPCLGTALQRKRLGDSEEDRSQQCTRGVARTERHV